MASDGSGGPKAGKNRKASGGGGGGAAGGKRTRSPETIAKQQASRKANAAAKAKVWGSLAKTPKSRQRQRVVIEGNKVTRTRIIKGRSSSTASARRGVNATVAGQSRSSPRRTARQTKKTQSAFEKQYRATASDARGYTSQPERRSAAQRRLAQLQRDRR